MLSVGPVAEWRRVICAAAVVVLRQLRGVGAIGVAFFLQLRLERLFGVFRWHVPAGRNLVAHNFGRVIELMAVGNGFGVVLLAVHGDAVDFHSLVALKTDGG